MKCPSCEFDNREGVKFCERCGTKMELVCPNCGSQIPLGRQFCGECGEKLEQVIETEKVVLEAEGERKHVTVLFSDLSGYTAMSEKLDPEEMKEIMSRIFGEIAQVVTKYEGFIEKFVGDAVMALFGVPKAHEDDSIRAIKVAREIHDLAEALSPELEKRIGQTISMHTGINTGLVVTGEVDMEKGTHGISGDTINLASRLSSLANAREILVGPDTYRQAEGHFTFESLDPTTVKGKDEPIQVHKVLSAKERPVTVRRLSGLRANLIGRKVEIAEFKEAVKNLQEGQGRIFSICGDAGTGKSRLVEEFKNSLNLEEVQWIEGHAYAYSQNIPYFPLIDLLNRVFQLEEGASIENVREKVEFGLENLVGKKEDVVPYVGGLYSLRYAEVDDVSPEFWKARLQDAIQTILSALAQRAPTVFFLEDLHWADPSFAELLRIALLEVRKPAIVLCVYRPTFSLFSSHQLGAIGKYYKEIRLQDLSPSEAQDMLESLLGTETIPSDLKLLVQDKAGGNPFFLEELVNSLIETETLIRDNGDWKVTKSISESEISSTIHGVIADRLDRLEKETKRILQEASVIGRAFLYDILKRTTELKDDIDRCLRGLEQTDLIRTRSLHPDLEYVFKHALTQEVAYGGLLKKERLGIHERIGLVMEQLFQDRLPEFYEALGFHFKRGHSHKKAVDYLIKSGEKSLERYAVEESHQYFKEALEVLISKEDRSKEEESLLINLTVKWAYVYYYKGDFKGLTDLLSAHEALAGTIQDRGTAGMFYGWLGMAMWSRERYRESQKHLLRALQIGEKAEDKRVIGYACTWLTWTCSELGLFGEALKYGERAQMIAKDLSEDHYLFFKSLGGIGFTHYYRGDGIRALEAGSVLIEYGQQNNDIRSMVMGHYIAGLGHFILGDRASSIECQQRAVQVSADPYYRQFPILFKGLGHFQNGEFDKANEAFQEVATFCDKYGVEALETPAAALQGAVLLATGAFKKGLKRVEECRKRFEKRERKWCVALTDSMLGQFYLQVTTGGEGTDLPFLLKNIRFLVAKFPFASNKANHHFMKCIETAEQIDAQLLLGEAYLGLALLHKSKKRSDEAKDCIYRAISIFELLEAKASLQQAKEALASLG